MSTRRNFLKGLAATAFTAGGQSLLSAPALAKGAPPPLFPNLTKGTRDLFKKNEIVAISDTNHASDAIFNALQDPGFLHELQKSRVKDLYIEISPYHQPQFDELAHGRMSMDDFKSVTAVKTLMALNSAGLTADQFGLDMGPRAAYAHQIETLGILAIHAARAGIKLHCADVQPLDEFYASFQKMKTRGDSDFTGMKDRLEKYDHRVAQMIQKTRTGKAMLVYGFLHTGIDWEGHDMFGKGPNIVQSLTAMGAKVGTLHMASDSLAETKNFYATGGRNQRLGKLIEEYRSWMPEKLVLPDLIYDVETDEIEVFKASGTRKTPRPAPSMP